MSKNILLCTLGASWTVIPEILGVLRQQHQLAAPDELWICQTLRIRHAQAHNRQIGDKFDGKSPHL